MQAVRGKPAVKDGYSIAQFGSGIFLKTRVFGDASVYEWGTHPKGVVESVMLDTVVRICRRCRDNSSAVERMRVSYRIASNEYLDSLPFIGGPPHCVFTASRPTPAPLDFKTATDLITVGPEATMHEKVGVRVFLDGRIKGRRLSRTRLVKGAGTLRAEARITLQRFARSTSAGPHRNPTTKATMMTRSATMTARATCLLQGASSSQCRKSAAGSVKMTAQALRINPRSPPTVRILSASGPRVKVLYSFTTCAIR
jgi:hypothetical protein